MEAIMTNFNIGDRVVHLDTYTRVAPGTPVTQSPYPNLVGKTATVVKVSDDHTVLDVEWDVETNDHGRNWSIGWFAVTEESDSDAVLTRPLVHFSDEKAGRARHLARIYAAEAVSKVLKPEDNAILKQAAAGRSVDAYALNRAVTAAIRSAVTRKGQSMARREQASHFAHLGHMVQAVLENHADNLPAYQNGERSRVIGKTNDVNRRLNEELRQKDGLLAEAQTAIAHAKVEVEDVTEQLRIRRSEVEAAEAAERTLRTNLTKTVAEANEFEAGLRYAQSLLDGASAAMVDAFIEGFRVGSED